LIDGPDGVAPAGVPATADADPAGEDVFELLPHAASSSAVPATASVLAVLKKRRRRLIASPSVISAERVGARWLRAVPALIADGPVYPPAPQNIAKSALSDEGARAAAACPPWA
jgi:hypothetical protein